MDLINNLVNSLKKKAFETLNNSAPVQGARMYGEAFQSPAVQKFASNAGNYLNQGLQQVSRQAPQSLYNANIRPTIQGFNVIKSVAVPTAQAYGNIIKDAGISYAKTTPAGQFIANNQNLLAKSSPNPLGNAYLKAVAPFRNPVTVEDVGNIASGVWGAPKVASNIIGGGIGYGINKFTKQDTDAEAYRKGIEFSSKVGGIGSLLETPLAPLVQKLNPTAAQKIGDLMDKGLTRQAFSQFWKNVRTAAITGGIEGGAYGAVLPAKNAEQWARNIFENATQFAAFSGGTSGVKDLSTIGFKSSVRGLKALQNNVNTQLKKGMTGAQLQEANKNIITEPGSPYRGQLEQKGVYELNIYDKTTGKVVRSKTYKTTADLRNAMGRIVLKENEIGIPRDVTPEGFERADLSIKLPSNEPLIQEAKKYKSAESSMKLPSKNDNFAKQMDELMAGNTSSLDTAVSGGNKRPPNAPPSTFAEAEARAGQAQAFAEDKGKVSPILKRVIGRQEVAKTTATERALPFSKIPNDIAEDVIRARENPNAKVPPEARAWADKLGTEYDKLFQEAQSAGMDVRYLQNYITHYWDRSQPEVAQLYRTFKQRAGFQNDRMVPTYDEGIKMGLKPRFTHPAQILEEYVRQFEKVKSNVELFKQLKDEGLVVPSSVGFGRPGFEAINAPGFPRSVAEGADGRVYQGNWFAPSNVARQLNKIFSPQEANKYLRIGSKVAGGFQDVVLSGGIPGTPLNAFTVANAQKEMLAGRVKAPIASFIRSLSPRATTQYFLENAQQIKKMQSRDIPIRSSMNVEDFIDRGWVKNTFGSSFGEFWSKVVNEPTFKRFMPQLQVRLFNDIEAQALKKGLSPSEAADVAAIAVKNFYGVKGKTAQLMGSANAEAGKTIAFMAQKFRESMLNFWGNTAKSVTNPFAFENRTNAKFMVGAIATYFGMNAINQALTGKSMAENPPGTEDKLLIPLKNGDVIGVPYLSSIATLPRAFAREGIMISKGDVSGAAKDAVQSYTSLLAKPLADVASNQDYFGKKIVDDTMSTGQKFASMAKYLGTQYLGHPYLRELFDQRNQSDPAYQRLSRAMELPFRFYTNKSLESKYYFGERDKALKGLSEKELQAYNAIPSYDKADSSNPNARILKYQIYLTYPSVFQAKQQTEIGMAKQTGKAIDPLYLVDYDTAKRYMRYETLPEGSQDRKDMTKAYPELLALFSVRGKYFEQNPIAGATQSPRPIPSAYVQQQMDAKNWADPQVRAYLDANTAWNNSQREKLGLPALAGYGSGIKKSSFKVPKLKVIASKKVSFKAKKPKKSKKTKALSFKIKQFKPNSKKRLLTIANA